MSKQHQHPHHEHGSEHHASKTGIHRDWRFWAVILMLAAMGLYVATMDESVLPGGQVEQPVPADAE
jgi:hypothetical protein